MYLLTYNDGDYYCEGMHVIGVFSTPERAATAQAEFMAAHSESWLRDATFQTLPIEVDHAYSDF